MCGMYNTWLAFQNWPPRGANRKYQLPNDFAIFYHVYSEIFSGEVTEKPTGLGQQKCWELHKYCFLSNHL